MKTKHSTHRFLYAALLIGATHQTEVFSAEFSAKNPTPGTEMVPNHRLLQTSTVKN
jgi:hypothetical protein